MREISCAAVILPIAEHDSREKGENSVDDNVFLDNESDLQVQPVSTD